MIKNRTEKLVIAGVFLALGVILPQLFHVFPVANTGGVLLPMHIPVILCGMVAGPVQGLIVGAVSPLISWLLTGMPNVVRLPFMICEVMVYGLTSGLVYKHLLGINKVARIYISLVAAMVCGRISYLFTLIIAISMLKIKDMSLMAVIDATVLGIPGIIIQLLVIPVMIMATDRAIAGKSKKLLGLDHTFVCKNNGSCITSDKKGIAPIMDILRENPDMLKGAKISDRVIGKAAALLLIKGGVRTLYTEIISSHALNILKKSNIRVLYSKKVDYIINRKGDGMCPMENATLNIDDPEQAYEVLKAKLETMNRSN